MVIWGLFRIFGNQSNIMGKTKYNTTKERVVGRVTKACRTASKRPKKIKKGINQCDITFELIYEMMETQNWACAECGHPFLLLDDRLLVEETTELGLNRLFLPSVDRIDNNKGYTMDNIRIVTQGYNYLKSIYDDNKVWEWINSIQSNK